MADSNARRGVSDQIITAIDRHPSVHTVTLTGSRARGEDRAEKREMVASELAKMHDHLLGPLGVERVPESVADAVLGYVAARAEAEEELEIDVPRDLEYEVRRLLAARGYTL